MKRPMDRLTAKEAAEEKGVHIKSLYQAVSDGRLKAEQEKPGSIIMIRRNELDAWRPRGWRPTTMTKEQERRQDKAAEKARDLAADKAADRAADQQTIAAAERTLRRAQDRQSER